MSMTSKYVFGRKLATRKPLNIDTALERLRMNASNPKYGFQCDGVVYFMSGWSKRAVGLLKTAGLVEEVGTLDEMKAAGIPVPEEFAQYKWATFYAADAKRLK